MVLQKIVQEIIKRGIRMAPYEAKIWKGLYGPSGRYPGVSNYKYAARGVQHGLTAGSIIGSLIKDGSTPFESGQAPSSYSYKKGNRRFNISRRNRRNKYNCYCGKRGKRLHRYRRNRRSRY